MRRIIMNLEFKVEEFQTPQPALSIRKTTSVDKLPQEIGQAYRAIMQYMGEIGEQPVGMPFAAYYNMDMQNLDTEIGFPVAKQIDGKNDVKASELVAGKYATCTYKGPYKEIGPAYEAIQKWIDDNGLKAAYAASRPCYEFYLNSPMEVPESELLTKIVIPVE
jgi:effector-binding domain-containing protein